MASRICRHKACACASLPHMQPQAASHATSSSTEKIKPCSDLATWLVLQTHRLLTAPGHLRKQIEQTNKWSAEGWKSFSLYKCLWGVNEGQKTWPGNGMGKECTQAPLEHRYRYNPPMQGSKKNMLCEKIHEVIDGIRIKEGIPMLGIRHKREPLPRRSAAAAAAAVEHQH